MLELRNRISGITLLHVVALGVPLLAGCELRIPGDDSDYDYDYDDEYRRDSSGLSGGTNPDPPAIPRYDFDVPVADGERPAALAPRPEPSYDGPGINTYVELVMLDPRSVGGPHAANGDADAPWSFRAQMGWLAGGDADALAFTVRWLDAWQEQKEVGTAQAPVNARPALRSVLLRPWLGSDDATKVSTIYDTSDPEVIPDPEVTPDPEVAPDPEAAPDPEVTADPERYPPAREADSGAPPRGYAADPDEGESESPAPDPYGALPPSVWAAAPFRLLAIVNRVDLAADACGSAAGELRYVYTATDARGERALDLSVIVEIPYPSTRSAASWARSWQGVAAEPAGPARDLALLALTREVALEADPLRVRVRTNEAALSEGTGPWQMREFQLASSSQGELALRQVPLAFTPRADADLGELAEHLLGNSEDVLAGGSALPESLRAGTAEMPAADFSWRVPGISERLRGAFSGATCNGCHAGDTKTGRFQHIAPGASYSAPARLSRFLYDDAAPTDELRRREALLVELSATACSDDPPSARGYY